MVAAPPSDGAAPAGASAPPGAESTAAPAPAVACTLGGGDAFGARLSVTRELFGTCTAIGELPDGYAFRFPGDEHTVAALAGFVAVERRCCRFLTYELTFGVELGPIVLRLRGSPDGKRFVHDAFVPADG